MNNGVKSLIDETLLRLRADYEFRPTLTRKTYANIVGAGFNRASLAAAFALTQLALQLQPITVRGLMYRAQAAGLYPSTSQKFYEQTARIVLKLRVLVAQNRAKPFLPDELCKLHEITRTLGARMDPQ
jgi:hypothetical protein